MNIINRLLLFIFILSASFNVNFMITRLTDPYFISNAILHNSDTDHHKELTNNQTVLYVITPTYTRLIQKAALTRLAQTMALVSNIHWIVIEDRMDTTGLVANILRKVHYKTTQLSVGEEREKVTRKADVWECSLDAYATNLSILGWKVQTAILCSYGFIKGFRPIEPFLTAFQTSNDYKNFTEDQVDSEIYPVWTYTYLAALEPVFILTDLVRHKPVLVLESKSKAPKATKARNKGLEWLNTRYQNIDSIQLNAVVYFADDDNTYDAHLFDLIKSTKRIAVWPVAFCGGLTVEKPLLKDGKVTGWDVQYLRQREFRTDMAGFSLHLSVILQHPKARFITKHPPESTFLQQLNINLTDIDSLTEEVMVWHTRLLPPKLSQEERYRNRTGHPSFAGMEI